MIISFTNVIGAIRSLGEAAEVITTNLKMWLGFETSVANQEKVVNGYFSDGTNNWSEEGNSTISVGTHQGKTDVADINILNTSNSSRIEQAFDYLNGKTYQVSVEVYLVSGSFRVDSRDSFVINDFVSTTTTGSWQTLTANITAIQTGTDVIWLRSDDEISQFYVNSISIKELTQITPDKSGNNNVGELFTGKALDFDGSTDNVAFTFTTPVKSAVFWVKPLGTGLENILTFGGAFAGTKSIRSNGNVISSLGLSSVSVYVDGVQTTSVPLNQWSRVVVNFDSVTPSELKFGYAFNSYGDIQLSDVQLYNENLTTDDIAYDYANPQNLVTDRSGTSIALSNLKGYWALSEGAGSIAYDSSGEGNNGTINGATYEPAQPRIPQLGMMNWAKSTPVADEVTLIPNPNNTSQDILGNAVRDRLNSFNLGKFGGARPDAFTLSGNQATIQLWFKNVNSNDSLYLADIHSATDRIVLGFNSSQLSVYHEITAAWQNFGTITDGDWNFATFIFDGTSLKCFVGTSQLGTTKTISAINIGTTTDFGIGMNHFFPTRTQDYNGHISDFLLYDRVLTSDEIENNYNAGLSAHTN